MTITNKKLSIVAAIIAGLYLVNAFININSGIVFVITQLISVALQGILAYAMYRDRNDKFTMIVVIIFAIASLSIPVGIIVILMLCRRYGKKLELAQKCWFVPAAVSALFSIFSIVNLIQYSDYYSGGQIFMNLFMILINIVNYLVLGYWLVKSLDIVDMKTRKSDASKEQKLTYYSKLHDEGVISDAEFEQKKNEIENQ